MEDVKEILNKIKEEIKLGCNFKYSFYDNDKESYESNLTDTLNQQLQKYLIDIKAPSNILKGLKYKASIDDQDPNMCNISLLYNGIKIEDARGYNLNDIVDDIIWNRYMYYEKDNVYKLKIEYDYTFCIDLNMEEE